MKKLKLDHGELSALAIAHQLRPIGHPDRQRYVNRCWEAIGRRKDIDPYKIVKLDQDNSTITVKD
jgi:hypothetical protein